MDLTLYGLAATPLIVCLVEVAKQAFAMPSRFAPLLSLALGILAGEGVQEALVHPNYIAGAVAGIGVGLAASGAFSGIAKLTQPTPVVAGTVTNPVPFISSFAPASVQVSPDPAPASVPTSPAPSDPVPSA